MLAKSSSSPKQPQSGLFPLPAPLTQPLVSARAGGGSDGSGGGGVGGKIPGTDGKVFSNGCTSGDCGSGTDGRCLPAPFRTTASRSWGVWSWICLTVIVVAASYADLSRFVNPAGEKYMPGYASSGQVDFGQPYVGARALLAHENPYTTAVPEFAHPAFGPEDIDGQKYRQLYPPTHMLTYVPLALIFGADVVAAGRLMFYASLVFLVLLGLLVWRLLLRVRGEPVSFLFVFPATLAIATSSACQLGLERGQSDILIALLCWTAMLLMLKRWAAVAMFLAVWMAAMKAYPALFVASLGVAALRSRVWRRAIAGAAVSLAVFVLPVARYLPYGMKGTLHRSGWFALVWFNHGFKHVVYRMISPGAADTGRFVLVGVSLLVAALWAWRVWQRRRDLCAPDGVLAVVMSGTSALLTAIGANAASHSYNLVVVLPAVLLLAAGHDRISSRLALSRLAAHVLGAAVAVSGWALFAGRGPNDFPLAGLGLVLLLGILAALGVKMGPRATSTTRTPA